ncbi:transcriptional regulator [Striga asiatica]|uniref:Transcriptional regulator n=1 Tax=Striga asiatica TaxID=4170 RepID=A0A5A7QN10_STRAF|nr:transcriptional regulator [Striga asiatica]
MAKIRFVFSMRCWFSTWASLEARMVTKPQRIVILIGCRICGSASTGKGRGGGGAVHGRDGLQSCTETPPSRDEPTARSRSSPSQANHCRLKAGTPFVSSSEPRSVKNCATGKAMESTIRYLPNRRKSSVIHHHCARDACGDEDLAKPRIAPSEPDRLKKN